MNEEPHFYRSLPPFKGSVGVDYCREREDLAIENYKRI